MFDSYNCKRFDRKGMKVMGKKIYEISAIFLLPINGGVLSEFFRIMSLSLVLNAIDIGSV